QLTPVPVFGGNAFLSVSAGTGASCGVVASGDALCWGDDSFSQLGVVAEPFTPLDTCTGNVQCSRKPRPVSSSTATPGTPFRASAVDVRGFHTCALGGIPPAAAFCWGNGPTGALGAGAATTVSPIPIQVAGGLTFVAISAGKEHTCALTVIGAAYCWGQGNRGQLGNGSMSQSLVPTLVLGQRTFS